MKYLITILIFFMGFEASAQQPIFSQYYSTGLFLNPALAGLEKDVTFQLNYRSQWSGAGFPFKTSQASYIHPIIHQGVRPKHTGGIGFSLVRDEAGSNGEFVSSGANMSYAHNLHLNAYGNHIVTIGGSVGLYQNRLTEDGLQWSSQYNPSIGFDGSSGPEFSVLGNRVAYPVMNVGLMWSFLDKKKFELKEFGAYAGISVQNLNKPNTSFFDDENGTLKPLTRIHGGFSIFITKKLSISPNYLIQYQNGVFQTNTGAYFGYLLSDVYNSRERPTKITFGAWYRLKDSYIFSAGVSSKNLNLAFSYDINSTSFGRFVNGAGAYEISLAFKLLKKQSYRRFSSPLI